MQRDALDVGLWRAVPLLLVPAESLDQRALWRGLDGARDAGDDVVPVPGVREVELRLGFAEGEEVAMSFDESGHDHASARIDAFRLHAGELQDLGVRTDGEDPVAAYGYGLGARMERVDGVDVAVGDDQVGA